MTSALTVPCAATARVSVAARLTHRCPFRDEVDYGRITVSWSAGPSTVELHALAVLLASVADRATSHEDVTHEVWAALTAAGVLDARVVTTWSTAGLGVTVAVPRERVVTEGA